VRPQASSYGNIHADLAERVVIAAKLTLSSRQGWAAVLKPIGFKNHPPPMTDNPTADSPFGASANPIDPFHAAKASAMKAAEDLRNVAAQKASELRHVAEQRAQQWRDSATHAASDIKEKADEFRQYADDTWKEARARCADLRVEAEKFAREKPVQALATAFGIGFVLGLLMRR
jgi:ElaB/YqjD/DUF883 family membrane-anchored ribosome-binding protein